MDYNFTEIEKKWQTFWAENKTFRAEDNSEKPKYYVLDMFPYPSGAGLHVGHPLGYIASDIMARYKRHKGFNVLHPMGYDSFGLPAEQYAIQTGQHPKLTTEQNIARYREQLDKIGFSFDWDREVRTSNPDYYKWTQWIFIQLFNSWYNPRTNKTEKIESLIKIFETEGCKGISHDILTGDIEKDLFPFTPEEWKNFDEKKKNNILMSFRIAYLGEAFVNWCPALGTVLANDEVKDGVSERGGYPVERKLMKQWSMRITAYAQRLLDGLDTLDWTESLKESQRYWIGRSEGTSLRFIVQHSKENIEVYTTRPDTVFGVSFVTLAPEHELVGKITTPEQKTAVEEYITKSKTRSERERQADVTKVSGVFTGAYVEHPFTKKPVPVWVGDYVLAGYGTGAVMAVPGHDSRDYAFAKHFNLPIPEVVAGGDLSKESYDAKEGKLINSDFLNGLEVKEAIKKAITEIEKLSIGKGKINYRLRDAVFGRQRYWGEPIPVYYKDGIPHVLSESELPLVLPEIDKFLPTEDGEPPLARAATTWKKDGKYDYEHTTMPGWAGSSWYYLRYMDAQNKNSFADKQQMDYWQNVDLYIGGSEHATGHLLYVRFWTKALYDLGFVPFEEPMKKLINQGMIQGVSEMIQELIIDPKIKSELIELNSTIELCIYRNEIIINSIPILFSHGLINQHIYVSQNTNLTFKFRDTLKNRTFETLIVEHHAKVNFVNNSRLNIDLWLDEEPVYKPILISEDGFWHWENKVWKKHLNETKSLQLEFSTRPIVEKMSKSKFNVVSPDDICQKFGADTLRLYEMFLGPLEQSKPWNTNGITGVSGFLKKLWRLFYSPSDSTISEAEPTKAELKTLHKTIKKITEDIERFSYNTSVSNFMICVNELTDLKCNKRQILEPLLVLISPYAPHITEELWQKLGHTQSIAFAPFPMCNEAFLVEDSFNYPISFNGKMRLNIELPATLTVSEIEREVMSREDVQKHLNGASPKKIIVVPKKIVNIVI